MEEAIENCKVAGKIKLDKELDISTVQEYLSWQSSTVVGASRLPGTLHNHVIFMIMKDKALNWVEEGNRPCIFGDNSMHIFCFNGDQYCTQK